MLATTGTAHARRIQGGILADGAGDCLSPQQYTVPAMITAGPIRVWLIDMGMTPCDFAACVLMSHACIHAGCNSFFGAIAMTLPSTTFAQNNGVIALTRCASRWAGVACGIWLIIFGVLAKVGGWVTTIPGDEVLLPACAHQTFQRDVLNAGPTHTHML